MPGQLKYNAVQIETAVIVDVDMDRWTVTLMTQNSSRYLTNVPWLTPYLHQEAGEGVHVVPEAGSQCMVLMPSDGEDTAYILAYAPIPREDSFRANRPDMNPGDMGFVGRDGNRVMVRRGGVIELSSGLATTLYLPLSSIIRHFAKQIETETMAGGCRWEVDVAQGGSAKTRYRLHVRRDTGVTGIEQMDVTAHVGSPHPQFTSPSACVSLLSDLGVPVQGDKSDLLCTLSVGRHTTDGTPPVFVLGVNAAGQLAVALRDVAVRGTGEARWRFVGMWAVEAQDVTHTSKDKNTTICKTHEVHYQTSTEKGSEKTIQAPSVNLGLGPHLPVVLGPPLVDALANAFIVVQDTPTGPVPLGRVIPGPGFVKLMGAFASHTKAS